MLKKDLIIGSLIILFAIVNAIVLVVYSIENYYEINDLEIVPKYTKSINMNSNEIDMLSPNSKAYMINNNEFFNSYEDHIYFMMGGNEIY